MKRKLREVRKLIGAMLAMTSFVVGVSAGSVFAGGWTSSGGRMLNDSDNPWFLHNTETVNYCILLDEENFGAPESVVRQAIRDALDYWIVEFGWPEPVEDLPPGVPPPDFGIPDAPLATQNFVEQSECNSETDLTFKLGVLNELEEYYLGNPREYIGVTVRTHYDPVHLRAKGFVYISPSFGPLKMEHERLAGNPWSRPDGAALKLVLTHELGHVFGAPHTKSSYQIMGSEFPFFVVTQWSSPLLSDFRFSFFTRDAMAEYFLCTEDGNFVAEFFGFSEDFQCAGFYFDRYGNPEIRLYETALSEPILPVGPWSGGGASIEYRPSGEIVLNARQTVFDWDDDSMFSVPTKRHTNLSIYTWLRSPDDNDWSTDRRGYYDLTSNGLDVRLTDEAGSVSIGGMRYHPSAIEALEHYRRWRPPPRTDPVDPPPPTDPVPSVVGDPMSKDRLPVVIYRRAESQMSERFGN